MSLIRKLLPQCVALAVLLCPVYEALAQCALCRKSLESGGDDGLIRGFYWSILLMLGVAFLLITGFVTVVYRSYQANLKQTALDADTP